MNKTSPGSHGLVEAEEGFGSGGPETKDHEVSVSWIWAFPDAFVSRQCSNRSPQMLRLYNGRNLFSCNSGEQKPEKSLGLIQGVPGLEAPGEDSFLAFSSSWWLPAVFGLWLHHSSLCICGHITSLSVKSPSASF